MKCRMAEDGAVTLELEAPEVRTMRFVAERACFMDTPPEEQARAVQMAEELRALLTPEDER